MLVSPPGGWRWCEPSNKGSDGWNANKNGNCEALEVAGTCNCCFWASGWHVQKLNAQLPHLKALMVLAKITIAYLMV